MGPLHAASQHGTVGVHTSFKAPSHTASFLNGGASDPLVSSGFAHGPLAAVAEDGRPLDGSALVPVPEALPIVAVPDEQPKAEEQKGDEHGLEADFARARRYKQIGRMLSNPKMREAVERLKRHSKVIAVMCTLVYLSSIITMRVMTETYNRFMLDLADSGLAGIAVMRTAINTLLLGAIVNGNTIQNEQQDLVTKSLKKLVDELDVKAKSMYLGDQDWEPPCASPRTSPSSPGFRFSAAALQTLLTSLVLTVAVL